MVISCFDESGHFSNADYLSVAGYISDEFGWRAFCQDWGAVLRRHNMTQGLHMKEFISPESKSPESQWDITKKIEVLREFIGVATKSNISPGLGVVLDAKHFRQVVALMEKEKLLKKPFQAQVFCFARIIRQVMNALENLSVDEPTAIVFDDSKAYSMKCYAYLRKLKDRRPDVRRKISGITFADDSMFYPLQVADLIAYAQNDQVAMPEPWKDSNVFSELFKSDHPDFGVVGYGEKFGPSDTEAMIAAIYAECASRD